MQLSNGIKIPSIGFGTALANKEPAITSVKKAISLGYRLIDTAAAYNNEECVGTAIKECSIDRKDLLITSKLWNDDHGYDSTLKALELTLKKLDFDYLDIYLIHWPNPLKFRAEGYEKRNAESWKAMEELYAAKKIRAIGVSNFMPHHLDALLKTATVQPMINQIRMHPGHAQKETVAYCKERNILIEAYSPLGGTGGDLLTKPLIQELSKKYQVSVSQLCIRWCLQMGIVPLPKSVNPIRIEENFNVFGFEINEEDMNALANMPDDAKGLPHPDEARF
ncbi:MAG: aldo/keto reductase [Fibromonadales bacterium]|nr:aldo/keto reductase [Fibromonadales bacterium]